MPLAQAHPWQPVPVKHEEDVNEVRNVLEGVSIPMHYFTQWFNAQFELGALEYDRHNHIMH